MKKQEDADYTAATPNKSAKVKKAAFVPLFSPDGRDRTVIKIPGMSPAGQ